MEQVLTDIIKYEELVLLNLDSACSCIPLDREVITPTLLHYLQKGKKIMIEGSMERPLLSGGNHEGIWHAPHNWWNIEGVTAMYVETRKNLFQPFFRQPVSDVNQPVKVLIEADYVLSY